MVIARASKSVQQHVSMLKIFVSLLSLAQREEKVKKVEKSYIYFLCCN